LSALEVSRAEPEISEIGLPTEVAEGGIEGGEKTHKRQAQFKVALSQCACQSALATLRLFGYYWSVSTVEEIASAVEKLPQKDLAKLAAFMDQHEAESAGHLAEPAAKSGADWFRVYMDCPHSFKIPPRKRQLYHRPKA